MGPVSKFQGQSGILKKYPILLLLVIFDRISEYEYFSREFEANVVILHHSTTISCGYQPVVHCGVLRQAAEMIQITGRESLKTGEFTDFLLLSLQYLQADYYSVWAFRRREGCCQVPIFVLRRLSLAWFHLSISRRKSKRFGKSH